MPTFTHELVDQDNENLLAQIFQLGVDSQLPVELGCSPIPYPTLTRIRDIAHDETLEFYVIYADGDLRVAIAFDETGAIRFCISKGWLDPRAVAAGAPPHPNGVAQTNYFYNLVRERTGDVKTFNNTQHPAVTKLQRDNGVTVIEVDSSGQPTGRERKP